MLVKRSCLGLVLSVLLAMPLAAQTSTTAVRDGWHTVRPGESLWSIARHYSISVAKLERWNHLRKHKIKPGQVLKVSAPG